MTIKILTGDCAEILGELPAESAHLVVTSPPYDQLRTYGGHEPFDLAAVAAGLYRVLVPGGVVCWNVGDSVNDGCESLTGARQAIHFVDVVGFRLHDTMIYEKLNFSHPETARYHQVWEYLYVFSKGEPRTFNPIKDKKNLTAGMVGNFGVNTFTERDGSKSVRSKKVTAEYGMRGNVWRGKTRGQERVCEVMTHPAMMPNWLAHDLIVSWSNPGDTVLDPFAGSGTTGIQAHRTERNAFLIDIHQPYVEMQRQAIGRDRQLFAPVA